MFTSPDRIVRRLVRCRFAVTMKNGETWQGVLSAADEHTLDLIDVVHILPDASTIKADGRILLPRCDVAYIQRT